MAVGVQPRWRGGAAKPVRARPGAVGVQPEAVGRSQGRLGAAKDMAKAVGALPGCGQDRWGGAGGREGAAKKVGALPRGVWARQRAVGAWPNCGVTAKGIGGIV